MSHRFDPGRAEKLEDESRLEQLPRQELLKHVEGTVADIGSGTGFYTDIIAEEADRVYAVDIQKEMHDFYSEKGVPENVRKVLAGADDLPFEDGEIDVLISINTFHEFPEGTEKELYRVLTPGGTIFIHDWSSEGEGEQGPPLEHRYSAEELSQVLEKAGFDAEADEHGEYFRIVARR